jgi:hypothetical protein
MMKVVHMSLKMKNLQRLLTSLWIPQPRLEEKWKKAVKLNPKSKCTIYGAFFV